MPAQTGTTFPGVMPPSCTHSLRIRPSEAVHSTAQPLAYPAVGSALAILHKSSLASLSRLQQSSTVKPQSTGLPPALYMLLQASQKKVFIGWTLLRGALQPAHNTLSTESPVTRPACSA